MWRARRILVVDDDAVVGRSINRVLTGQGYQVREAMSGSEALEELDHQEYDAVFTDIRMPGMDGLEMAARVKKSHPGMPVVVITGFGSEANESRARALGVSGFLHKPLTPEMIVDNAARALRERSETQEAIRQSAVALMASAAAPSTAPAAAAQPRESVAKNVGLFFAAPFIGLAYFLAVPFVGFYAIGRYGWKALTKAS
jgi:DNA-binding NtrC family response regulator